MTILRIKYFLLVVLIAFNVLAFFSSCNPQRQLAKQPVISAEQIAQKKFPTFVLSIPDTICSSKSIEQIEIKDAETDNLVTRLNKRDFKIIHYQKEESYKVGFLLTEVFAPYKYTDFLNGRLTISPTFNCKSRSGETGTSPKTYQLPEINQIFSLTIESQTPNLHFIMVPLFNYEDNETFYQTLLLKLINRAPLNRKEEETSYKIQHSKTIKDFVFNNRTNYIILGSDGTEMIKRYYNMMQSSIPTTINLD